MTARALEIFTAITFVIFKFATSALKVFFREIVCKKIGASVPCRQVHVLFVVSVSD